MSTVALAATAGMLHFELGLATEVFGADVSHIVEPWYDFAVCGSGPVQVGRFQLRPDHDLEFLSRADTVIVPAIAEVDDAPPADLVDAVRTAYDSGSRVVSLCTGVFVLAAAGLLDGLHATTHWAHTDALAARYPKVRVDPDALYVDNGRVLDIGGQVSGNGPVPAPRAARLRTGRRQRDRPPPRRAAASAPAARPSSSPPPSQRATTIRWATCSRG